MYKRQALKTALQATRPNGSTHSYDLDAVRLGESATRTTSYTVPADACPTTYTTSGTASFTSFAGFAGQASGQAQTQVLDIQPPTLSVSATPDRLWPPNHKMKDIALAIDVHDNCDPNPAVRLISVTSSEPDNGLGDGDTADDIQGAALDTDDRAIQVRAERAGGGAGRVYTIRYRATDFSGNATEATTTVTVPHNP